MLEQKLLPQQLDRVHELHLSLLHSQTLGFVRAILLSAVSVKAQ